MDGWMYRNMYICMHGWMGGYRQNCMNVCMSVGMCTHIYAYGCADRMYFLPICLQSKNT